MPPESTPEAPAEVTPPTTATPEQVIAAVRRLQEAKSAYVTYANPFNDESLGEERRLLVEIRAAEDSLLALRLPEEANLPTTP